MKTCLIYGQDGLDLCVTLNLKVFYERLGLKVFFSEKLYDADMLVVARAYDSVDLSPYSYQLIHIFDYVGRDFDAFIHSVDYEKSFIFCTSEIKRQRIIEKTGFPSKQIFQTFPPVETEFWIGKPKKIRYYIVHIGNYKFSAEGDIIKAKFDDEIQTSNVDVWGLGWDKIVKKGLYHGRLGTYSVPSIYAQSMFALGLMYPFQREVTYSGRFWQAPLNGCFLLSEPGLYTKEIPGIIETDYSHSDIETKINTSHDRQLLKKEAKDYWEKQYDMTLSYVRPTLDLLNVKRCSMKKYVIWMRLSLYNRLRICYHRYSLFKIMPFR
jgi:uncharacterized protein Usg